MQQLALQVDSRGVTAVLVEAARGRAPSVLGVATTGLVDDAEKLATAISAALPHLKRNGLRVAVALGPEGLRLRRLAVPPAPEEEMPPLVRMQAQREAGAAEDDLVVDYLPGDGPRLLVAWCDEATLAHWRAVASELGGRLAHLVPRAVAPVGLLDHRENCLIATRAGDAVDFVVEGAAGIEAVRSVRATVDETDATAERELRRTLLSLQSDGEETQRLRIAHDGSLAGGVQDGGQDDGSNERFAIDYRRHLGDTEPNEDRLRGASAALGAALRMTAETPPPFDLANPRQAADDSPSQRPRVLLAVAAALVLAAGAWMAYQRSSGLDRQIAELNSEIRTAEEGVEQFMPFLERVNAIDSWLASDVTWLDEVERLGRKLRPATFDQADFPVDSDVRVTGLLATARIGGDERGGRIALQAAARSPATSELETRLRDNGHLIEPLSTVETTATDAYRYAYRAMLRVPADRDEVKPTPSEPPAQTPGETPEEAPDASSEEAASEEAASEEAAPEEAAPEEAAEGEE